VTAARRTIVMLSPKRSGSTAMFRLFQGHPDVQVAHHDQSIALWETQFWSMGADAIAGDDTAFKQRMQEAFPFLGPLHETPSTSDELFALWDAVLDRLGPVVFDKSPQYLDSPAGLDLLREYRERGNDVRPFGFVRHPQDTITSQHELWGPIKRGGTVEDRERHWLGVVERLERERGRWDMPVYVYEEFAADPDRHAADLLRYLGLEPVPESWAHIRPVNVGKHSSTWSRQLRSWTPSEELREVMRRYGYEELRPTRRRRMPTRLELGARLRRLVP
jgi:hypothetical protein